MSEKQSWVWMPHAAHFCLSNKCQFHLATYVGDCVVSTVGELFIEEEERNIHNMVGEWGMIGWERSYETMVFRAAPRKDKCCPWQAITSKKLDFNGYTDAEAATEGHYAMCEKWAGVDNKETSR